MSEEKQEEKTKKKHKGAGAPTPVAQPPLPPELPPPPDPFETFTSILKERDPDLSNLEKPARKDQLDEAETKLKAPFPPLFREFMLRWNGGTAHETCIYGVGT